MLVLDVCYLQWCWFPALSDVNRNMLNQVNGVLLTSVPLDGKMLDGILVAVAATEVYASVTSAGCSKKKEPSKAMPSAAALHLRRRTTWARSCWLLLAAR